MIICSTSNIDLIHGVVGYGNVSDGTTDWRITNTKTAVVGQTGILNILNSTSTTPNFSIIENGNIGIGTAPNINNKLILYNAITDSTSLSIANNYTSNYTSNYTKIIPTFIASFTGVDNNAPSTHDVVTATPTDRYMIFTAANINYTFTVPTDGLNCDILMIGGGGAGGSNGGGGGGAGACIIAINQTLSAGVCVVNVGTGGTASINGGDSFIKIDNIDRYRAKGGGFSSTVDNVAGTAGGCGGGATYNTDTTAESGGAAVSTNVVNGSLAIIGPSITSTYAVMGNSGGSNGTSIGNSGSGGGIGTVGVITGKGGDGAYQVTLTGASTPINFRNYFANGSTTFGVQDGSTGNYYIGGGGGGYGGNYFAGGLGGAGSFSNSYTSVANTGSGGTGGGSGATGIIIIRYRSESILTQITSALTLIGSPSIELIRGTTGDSNTDYKLGNYNGDFKVISTSLSSDTDRFAITSSGNIGIGITNPAVKLHVSGGDLACSGDIISYYSDERLKTKLSNIKDPLEIINNLNGFYYIPNDLARIHGITNTRTEVGLSAQEVQKVLPEIVKIAPFDLATDENDNNISKSGENYLTLSYDRLAPIFVEAIKELSLANKVLNEKYNNLLEIISKNKE
jgi:hypothetical protein